MTGELTLAELLAFCGTCTRGAVLSPAENFIVAGGDSLSALEVVAWLDIKFGIQTDVLTIFESETLGDLFQALTSAVEAER